MNIELNPDSIISFVLISQGVFASVLLFLKKGNRKANFYLSLLTIFMSFWLLDTFFRVSGIYNQNPNFYFLPIYFSLGFGPLIYLYTKNLTHKNSKFKWNELLHFIPVWIQFLFYSYLQFQDYEFRRIFWIEIHLPFTYDLELILSFLSIIIYLIYSRKLIINYKTRIENNFSNTYRITLRWLNQLHVVLFVLSILWLIEALGRLFFDIYQITPLSSITIAIIILLVAIGGILQKDLSKVTKVFQKSSKTNEYQKKDNDLDPSEINRIKRIMASEELYLQQELTLKEFALQVNLSPRETSKIINQGLNISFIDFVNQYRITRFKDLIQTNKINNFSLVGLAYESGFNSKSTFNRVFKKMEGESPSNYLNTTQNRN